jgi:hypothetical protein
MILYLHIASSMGDDRQWMYDGWKKSGAHTHLWWHNTKDFIERALSLASTKKIRCPFVKCQSVRCFDKGLGGVC